MARLARPRDLRMIAGVCAALAVQYGWDLSLVRILTVVLTLLTGGFGVVCYLAAWVIIPDASWALPAESAYTSTGNPPSGSAGNTTV